jgi:type IV secretion system protein VirB11
VTTRETQDRRLEDLLKRQFGQPLLTAMADPGITDILINQDGSVWYEAAGKGLYSALFTVAETLRESIIGTVAAMLGMVADRDHPIVEGELILERIRFEGLMRPIVPAPCIAMRKPSRVQFTFSDYIRDGILTQRQAEVLREAIKHRRNIAVGGATGSGKTTFAGAVLNETVRLSGEDDRYVTIEDTLELAFSAKNLVQLRASDTVDMTRLLRATMRLRPDRIIIGEVRGAEALTMLKAWGTGHPGGVTTVHANSARGVLTRLSSLVQEAGVPPQPELIAETINLIAFIERSPLGERRITELLSVDGYDPQTGFALTETAD